MGKIAECCIVFHFHQPPYDEENIHYYDQCYERSYKTHLDALDSVPDVKANFNITGILLRTMERRNPEFIERLGKKVVSGQVYLTSCGYSHPIFPIVLERLGKGACGVQIERDREIKKRLFGVEPEVFRFPEYAVSEDSVRLLGEYGFEGTIVPDFVFQEKGIDRRDSIDRGIRIVGRNNYLSNVLAGNDFFGCNNFRWLASYGGTPERVGEDFAEKIISAERALTDCDAESYNHWLIESGVPDGKRDVLRSVYGSLAERGVETRTLPEFIRLSRPRRAGSIPRVSYAGDLGIWEGRPEHEDMWRDAQECWESYVESGDPEARRLAMRAQTSCWTWGVTHNYPEWWREQPKRYKAEIDRMLEPAEAAAQAF